MSLSIRNKREGGLKISGNGIRHGNGRVGSDGRELNQKATHCVAVVVTVVGPITPSFLPCSLRAYIAAVIDIVDKIARRKFRSGTDGWTTSRRLAQRLPCVSPTCPRFHISHRQRPYSIGAHSPS